MIFFTRKTGKNDYFAFDSFCFECMNSVHLNFSIENPEHAKGKGIWFFAGSFYFIVRRTTNPEMSSGNTRQQIKAFMKASVEISMYPLNEEYGTTILEFIHRLKQYEHLKVHSNTMSSQVFGDYDEVMSALTREMKISFEEDKTTVIVMKVVNLDLQP